MEAWCRAGCRVRADARRHDGAKAGAQCRQKSRLPRLFGVTACSDLIQPSLIMPVLQLQPLPFQLP